MTVGTRVCAWEARFFFFRTPSYPRYRAGFPRILHFRGPTLKISGAEIAILLCALCVEAAPIPLSCHPSGGVIPFACSFVRPEHTYIRDQDRDRRVTRGGRGRIAIPNFRFTWILVRRNRHRGRRDGQASCLDTRHSETARRLRAGSRSQLPDSCATRGTYWSITGKSGALRKGESSALDATRRATGFRGCRASRS
ncbi:hypothetical protein B0H14DRAFT_10450 [Mycena olivaceomarginata]|nr:hypothetical protein B0H14DRAFT_10450 [Mycena olivaceomarginata]